MNSLVMRRDHPRCLSGLSRRQFAQPVTHPKKRLHGLNRTASHPPRDERSDRAAIRGRLLPSDPLEALCHVEPEDAWVKREDVGR